MPDVNEEKEEKVIKRKITCAIAALVPLVFMFCFHEDLDASQKLKVVASFYPLVHFAEKVGGDRIDVINITPAGAEPHDFEPTPKDMKYVWTSKVFIFNGAGIDPWAERIRADLEKKGILTIEMAGYFDLLRIKETKEEHKLEHKHEEVDGYHHFNSKYDPHIWLDPVFAQKEVEIIRDTFIKTDPENEDKYKKNSEAYIYQLAELDKIYKEGLKSCKVRTIVVSHNAFSYLAKRYFLETISISGLSPDEEPSPRRMAEIVRTARKNNVQYIFFETLISPRIAETIAREIGAKTLILNTVEGLTRDEIKAGKSYLSIMEENLNNLRKALSCK